MTGKIMPYSQLCGNPKFNNIMVFHNVITIATQELLTVCSCIKPMT